MRRLGLAVGVVAFAASLAGLLWLTAYFIAPPLFGVLWRGAPSPWTPRLLALMPALMVAIPFGIAFGVLPWKRGGMLALAVAMLAGIADLATVMRSGIDVSTVQGRSYAVADALFVVLFTTAASVGRRLVRDQPVARRGWRGAWAWLALGTAFCAAAAWSWARIMPHGIQ